MNCLSFALIVLSLLGYKYFTERTNRNSVLN